MKANWKQLLVLGLTLAVCYIFYQDTLEEHDPFFKESAEVSFVIFLALALWSYVSTMLSDPGYAHKEEILNAEHVEFCNTCRKVKPERCVHCPIEEKCVLGFDHHSEWMGNCIGLRNKKYYILTFFYATCALIDVFIFMLWISYELHLAEDEIHPVFWAELVFLGVLSGITLKKLLQNVLLVSDNVMRVEWDRFSALRRQGKLAYWLYNAGPIQNLYEVLGPKMIWWWLPCKSEPLADGYSWKNYE